MGIIDNEPAVQTWSFDPVTTFAGSVADDEGWPVLTIDCGPDTVELPSSEATAQDAMAAARRIQEAIWVYMQAVTTRRLQDGR